MISREPLWDIHVPRIASAPSRRFGFQLIRPRARQWPQNLCAVLLSGIVMLAPLPAASNQPQAWMLWAALIGLIGAFAFAAARPAQVLTTRHIRLIVALGLILPVLALLQALPLAALSGGITLNLPTGTVQLSSLSIAPGASFLAAIRLTSYLIFFVLMLWVARDARRAKQIGTVLFYSIAAQAFWAMAQLRLGGDGQLLGDKVAYLGNATGTFVGRSAFATFLGIGLVLGLALLLGAPDARHRARAAGSGLRRTALLVGLSLILIALISTQSRLGVAATFVAAFIVVLPFATSRRRSALGAAVLLAVVLAYFGQGLAARIAALGQSADTRFELYAQVAQMIRTRPLTGFGLDSFALAFQLFHAPPVTAAFVWDRAHSTYLTLWSEAGLLAGSAPPLAGLVAARRLWRAARALRPGRSMAIAGLAALTLGGLHSIFDFSLEIQANTFLLIAMVGLGLGPLAIPKGAA